MRRSFLVFLLSVALWPAAAEATKGKVAVTEFKAVGLEPRQAKALQATLGSILTAEIAKLGYSVMSTADINAMLAFEQQRDLLGCGDASCLAEIGGALGVDLLVNGTIGLVGGTYTVALTLVDSKRAKVKQRFVGNAGTDAVLSATVKRGVGVLFGAIKDTSGSGTIFVKTDPSGATISLDGKEVGVSPTTVDGVAAGDHLVVATLGQRRAEATVTLEAEAIERVVLTLASAPPVKLMLNSEPPEARVFFGGVDRGTTPLMLAEVPSGKVEVRLELEGHEPKTATFDLSFSEFEEGGRQAFRRTVKLDLPWVPLTLVGLPRGARVLVDGQAVGVPMRAAPGSHVLRVEAQGYDPFERTITLAQGTGLILEPQLSATSSMTEYLEARDFRSTWFTLSAITAGVLAVGAGAMFYLSADSKKNSDAQHERYSNSDDQAQMDELYTQSVKEMENARAHRTRGLMIAGTAAAAAVAAILFRATYPDPPDFNIGVGADAGGASLVLQGGF